MSKKLTDYDTAAEHCRKVFYRHNDMDFYLVQHPWRALSSGRKDRWRKVAKAAVEAHAKAVKVREAKP